MEEWSLAGELVAAIASGAQERLLSKWRDQTVVNLKLEKVPR
jgi:hypothetical protein